MKKKHVVICLMLSTSYAQAQQYGNAGDNSSFLAGHFFSYLVTFLAGCLVTSIIMVLIKPKKKSGTHHRNSSGHSTANNRADSNRVKNTINKSSEHKADSQPSEPTLQKIEEKEINIVSENIDNLITKESGEELSVLFFPNPNIEGNFRKVDGRTSFVEGASIYKFNVLSYTEAEFEFCKEKSSISIALNNRNELILNVAEELNAYNSRALQILSDPNDKGIAILDGSVWKVTKKAKIKYI